MKSPERVLRQWICDEISFKISGRRYVWTRSELRRFIVINYSGKLRVAVVLPDGKALPTTDYDNSSIGQKLRWKRHRKFLDPRNFAAFYSLDELAQHLEVEL